MRCRDPPRPCWPPCRCCCWLAQTAPAHSAPKITVWGTKIPARCNAEPPIHHYDLYRLEAAHDLARLDLAGSFASAVSLVEWPQRLGSTLPPAHLALTLTALEAEEQAVLAAAAVAESEAAAWVAAAAGGGSEAGWSDGDGDSDSRWRRVRLVAMGSARWAARLRLLEGYLQQEGLGCGCLLEGRAAAARQAA